MLFMCYDVTLLRLTTIQWLIHRKAWRRQHVTSYQCYDECYDLNYIQNRARYSLRYRDSALYFVILGAGMTVKLVFNIISSIFDYNPNVETCMKAEVWQE